MGLGFVAQPLGLRAHRGQRAEEAGHLRGAAGLLVGDGRFHLRPELCAQRLEHHAGLGARGAGCGWEHPQHLGSASGAGAGLERGDFIKTSARSGLGSLGGMIHQAAQLFAGALFVAPPVRGLGLRTQVLRDFRHVLASFGLVAPRGVGCSGLPIGPGPCFDEQRLEGREVFAQGLGHQGLQVVLAVGGAQRVELLLHGLDAALFAQGEQLREHLARADAPRRVHPRGLAYQHLSGRVPQETVELLSGPSVEGRERLAAGCVALKLR